MNRRTVLTALPLAGLIPGAIAKAADPATSTTVYELRVYHAADGKLDDLLARFRHNKLEIFRRRCRVEERKSEVRRKRETGRQGRLDLYGVDNFLAARSLTRAAERRIKDSYQWNVPAATRRCRRNSIVEIPLRPALVAEKIGRSANHNREKSNAARHQGK